MTVTDKPQRTMATWLVKRECILKTLGILMSILLINIPSVITKSLISLRKLQSFQPPCRGTKSFGFHATTLQH